MARQTFRLAIRLLRDALFSVVSGQVRLFHLGNLPLLSGVRRY